jgi:hypothetical protein
MNRDQFHVGVTRAAIVEAMSLFGRPFGLEEHARDYNDYVTNSGVLIGRACGSVDAMDDKFVKITGWVPGDRRTITQVAASRGISLSIVLGKSWTRDYEAVNSHHFEWTEVKEKRLFYLLRKLRHGTATIADMIESGYLLHTFEDCGREGCPHWGYVGVPSPINKLRTKDLDQLKWYKKIVPAKRTWGHMLCPDADKVQNCRSGAISVIREVIEAVSGRSVYHSTEGGEKEVLYYFTDTSYRCETLIAIANAKDDKDLVSRTDRIYKKYTGDDTEKFERFEGTLLDLFWSVVRRWGVQ